MSEQNPLVAFYRRPEIEIKLPSAGRWWADGSISIPPNGELPVLPMSGKDEITIKTADSLINGSATVNVVQSCCPSIKNAWEMPTIDLDYLFIAIRLVTYGPSMDFSSTCPHCKQVNDFTADLSAIMQGIKVPNYDQPLQLDSGLNVFFRPSIYKQSSELSQAEYIQEKTVAMLQGSNLPDDQKLEELRKALAELTNISVTRMADFVDKISMPSGTVVSDKKQIQEFIMNASQRDFTAIQKGIAEKNAEYKLPLIDVECIECKEKTQAKFTFELQSFFSKGS
jgi:hypothetical protein